MSNKTTGLRTWIEIDRKAIKNNVAAFRKHIQPLTKLMAVVKSNAYGHGLIDFAFEMERLGADFLGVDSVVEGLALRRQGIKIPILILGYTLPERLKEAAEAHLSITVSTFETLAVLQKMKWLELPKIHIKIDSGMHRQGFLEKDLKKVLKISKEGNGRYFILEGLFTHLAAAKNPAFPYSSKHQLAIFNQWVSLFKKIRPKPIFHASATGGTILFPDSHFDMVRVGIGLYGLWPASEVEAFAKDWMKLKPALSWHTVIGEIKYLPRRSKVGYDFTEALAFDSTVAICPVGYWHGLPRALSSIGRVLVNGKRARIVGRVSMDMIVIDVSSCGKVRVGDEVVLIGRQGKEEVRAIEMAALADTSHYEIVTRLNPLIKKIYQ